MHSTSPLDSIKNFRVESQEPVRLIDFLIISLPDTKRTRIKQMLAHRQVALRGVPVTQATALANPGDEVAVNFSREFREFRHRRLRIVYEDDDILVIEKGYGLLSVGNESFTPTGESEVQEGPVKETAYSILRDYLKWKDPRNKLFIVHRLDRDTSGLMMFAKNVEAKEAMQHNWDNMVISRKYVCVVDGEPDPQAGTVRSYLGETSRYEVYSSPVPVTGGKLAVTRYRATGGNGRHTMMEVELDTGRKNQIRVHMKDLGTPISGDRRYGGATSPAHRLCLHAQTLRFVHPVTRKDMNFQSTIPSAFFKLIK